ncbi:hypothetical protein K7X08_015026 [Anisodus acutangulus]|uniref:Uncharacterized protein n=1 Tax=Anisodus acutangulus TaxID=402998 RepID=A0A9Q1L523_9SOLA|nr:hypothetical protein K7X08_015026 [Anisodus acutangulus]
MSELRIIEVTTFDVSLKEQDEENSIQAEVLDKKEDGGDNNSTVITTHAEIDSRTMEQVVDGKVMEREVNEIEVDASAYDEVIGHTYSNEQINSSAQQIGYQVEKSCNNISAKEISNSERASSINIEVSVDKVFIDGRDTSSKKESIILSTENPITEEEKIVEGVEVSTVGDITKSYLNKELHALVSHDMNRLDTGSKEDVVHKGNGQVLT